MIRLFLLLEPHGEAGRSPSDFPRTPLRHSSAADDVVDAVHAWRAGETTDADDLTIVIVEVG